MKKVIAVTICAALLLSGCSFYTEPPKVYDAGDYRLAAAFCEGEAVSAEELYPEGGRLVLASDGTGILRLGDEECEVSWSEGAGAFSMAFAGVAAKGTAEAGVLDLTMGDTGLELIFSTGEYAPPEETPVPETPIQLLWNGERSGRMWFEEADGEWADYTLRSEEVSCTVQIKPDGEGSVLLFSKYYSESVPMARLEVIGADGAGKCRVSSGYFMDMNLAGRGDLELKVETCPESELRSTEIITFNGKYGHFFEAEEPSDEEISVMRLAGCYESESGSFRFYIELM